MLRVPLVAACAVGALALPASALGDAAESCGTASSPYSPPGCLTAQKTSITKSTLKVSKTGTVSPKVNCPKTQLTDCSGTLTGTLTVGKKKYKLATQGWGVTVGKKASITVTLSATGLKAVKKAKKGKLALSVTNVAASGSTKKTSATLTVKT